jgi:hypothetical protein
MNGGTITGNVIPIQGDDNKILIWSAFEWNGGEIYDNNAIKICRYQMTGTIGSTWVE